MQINRLFEIVYILLDKKTVTAKELAERFEVSSRTIYRDVETLSSAGIPIFMSKGKGGGISLLDNFVLNKSVLSENEQNEILSALQGLNMLNMPNVESVLNKLGTLFNKSATSWIDIDFSYWGSDNKEKEKFNLLKSSILSKVIISFEYFAPNREMMRRTVEPLQIYFKEKAWYLKAYCTEKQDYRTFKITRMRNIEISNTTYSRELKQENAEDFSLIDINKLILKFNKSAISRVYDELEEQTIVFEDENFLIAEINCPEDEWIYSFILSYGVNVEVIEPLSMRKKIQQKLQESLKIYS